MTVPTVCALLALLGASTLAAQTAPCLSLNDTTTTTTGNLTAFSFGPPNKRAYAITPATTSTVVGMRFFTGNAFLAMPQFFGVEIYSDSSGFPAASLGAGIWKLQTTARGWYGANLDHPVTLTGGTTYWLVFQDPGFSELPEEPTGTSTTFCTLGTAGWLFGGTARPKYRLFCGPLDGLNITAFGPSCSGSNGATPTAYTNQAPTVGNNLFGIEGSGFAAGATSVLVIGYTPGFPSILLSGFLPNGCYQNTDVAETRFGTSETGARAGYAFFAVPVPPNPILVGVYASVQIGVVDAAFAVPLPLITTNALHLTIY